ncbi:MAG TPA: prepilin-type N-terminal cleavage/methylation domain-containing protein [Phycisphaerae bacterium]|jgi:prepilin-type N-terminal cleavage/methylation domain-containing protein/prepilin-type processing-associated H-X9-DG protein|nr:prepilin-type N-terminal cleavage/methylation domain-containing protein [Phycisphaerae bacterium]HQL55704.1 prepilin-type N-terminal cleavage/methylation domain-containing protein [Phycisphaerae bacterium]
MRASRGFSLIELLVCTAIIAVLLAILAPSLSAARAQAQRVQCASNLRQLAVAWHCYTGEYRGRAMPLAYTDLRIIGSGPPVYWWGTNDVAGVDHTRGFVWPYLRSDLRVNGVYECPRQPWGTYIPQGAARAVTSTYGYNGYYLCPPHTPGWTMHIGAKPWKNLDLLRRPQALFLFADTLIDLGQAQPENDALLDPPSIYFARRWIPNSAPTTAFRHRGRTNAAAADGHVAAHGPTGGAVVSRRFGIGSVGAENDPHYVPDWQSW